MKTFVLYFLSLLGLVRCGLFDNVEDEEVEGLLARPCLPLPECEPLMYMIRNKDSIPGLSREDVFRSVRNVMCGFEDATPKVFCNLPEEEEDNEEYVAPRRGGIIDVLDFGEECAGALKLFHFKPGGDDARLSVLRRPAYLHLRRLKSRLVYTSQVNGNCCWRINENTNFNGRDQTLPLGASVVPDVQPKSARVVPC